MRYHLKISTTAILSGVLLLSGCVSVGKTNNNQKISVQDSEDDNLYTFPKSMYEGYWAMVGDIDGETPVLSFRDNLSYNYRFKCNADGSYIQVDEEVSELIPSKTGMQIKYLDGSIMTELKVQRLSPNKVLLLNQMFIEPTLKEAVPDGIEFVYFYTSTLKPICT